MKNLLLIVMMGIGFISYSQLTYQEEKVWELCVHAKWQTTQNVTYDRSYRVIDYPNGDVPDNIGVCTDVIIRAYRFIGIDLQQLVHESVKKNLRYYYPRPGKDYGEKPDANIDHRRVMVLKKWLKLHYPSSQIPSNGTYEPGDLIFWHNWHIAILIDKKVPGTSRYYAVHNVGEGPVVEDIYYDPSQYGLEHYRLNFNK